MPDSILIPRVFHFIWIGPKDLSEEHQKNIDSWRHHHPDWEVRVWRNEDIPRLRNQEQFDRALAMAGKADILRAELVHDQGGVYLDIDMECLRPIDELLAGCEGFLTCEHQSGRIGNAVFGAVPGHEFMRHIVEAIPRWFHPQQPHRTGPTLFTHMGRRYATMRIFEQMIFFPPSTDDQHDSDVRPEFPGSYAVHWYDASWEQDFPVTQPLWVRLLPRAIRRLLAHLLR